MVRPDASFELAYRGHWQHYFLEFERRSTTPRRVPARLESYRRYFQSGWAVRDSDGRLPRVLSVFESPADEAAFLRVAARVEWVPFRSAGRAGRARQRLAPAASEALRSRAAAGPGQRDIMTTGTVPSISGRGWLDHLAAPGPSLSDPMEPAVVHLLQNPVPRRWVVERACGWRGRCRRLSKDDEAHPVTGETWSALARCALLLRRLCPSS